MPDFNIRFKTTTEGDGAKKTAEAIKEVTAASQAAKPAVQDHADAVDKATGAKKRWIEAFKQLKHEIPGLSTAITLLKNPLAGLTALIAVFTYEVKRKIDAINEAAAADAKAAAEFGALSIALGVYSRAAAGLADAERARIQAMEDAQVKLKDTNDLLEKRLEFQKTLIENEKTLASLAIDTRVAQGGLTEHEANKLKVDLGLAASRKVDAAEDAKLNEEIRLKKAERDKLREGMPAAEAETAAAKKQFEDFTAGEQGLAGIGGAKERRQEAFKKAKEDQAAAEAQIAEIDQGVKLTPFGPRVGGFEVGSPAWKEQQDELAVARKRKAEAEATQKKLITDDLLAGEQAKDLQTRYEAAKKTEAGMRGNIGTLGEDISKTIGTLQERMWGREFTNPQQNAIGAGQKRIEDTKALEEYKKELIDRANKEIVEPRRRHLGGVGGTTTAAGATEIVSAIDSSTDIIVAALERQAEAIAKTEERFRRLQGA